MAITRRDFLLGGTAAGAVVGGAVLVPLGFVLSDEDGAPDGATGALLTPYPRVRIGSVSGLETGTAKFFDYPYEDTPNVLVKLDGTTVGGVGPDEDIAAFSSRCTHMGCPITTYQADTEVLGPCPCHFTSFDLSRDGVPALGQATQNLPRVLLEVEGDDIFAVGVYRLVYGHGDNLTGENLVAVGGEG